MSELGRSPLTVLSDEEHDFQSMIDDFAAEKVRPRVEHMDRESKLDAGLIKEIFDLGVMGIEVPADLGGAESSFFMSILAIEAFSRVDASIGVFVDVQNTLFTNALMRWCTPDQKKHYFPLTTSKMVGAFALSEPACGSDAFAMTTRATADGDSFRLNGRKLWITNGAEAGVYLLFATVDPAQGYKGVTAFLVEREFPGFAVGKKEDKLGIRASSTCELILEDCRVPKQNVVGEVGKGYKVAIETLNEGRIGIGAQMIGIARGAFEHACAYIQERKAFGKRIADFQGVQFDVSRMATEIEAGRLLVYNAARLKDAGLPFLKEAAMAKYYTSKMAESVASLSLELYGGYGFTKDFPAEKYYRDAKIGAIYEGTTNMQLGTIAKEILK